MLKGVVSIDGHALRIYSLHLGHLSRHDRLTQIKWLLELNHAIPTAGGLGSFRTSEDEEHQEWMPAGRPVIPFDTICLGYFNLDPGDIKYEKLVGPDDPSHEHVTYGDLTVDAWTAVGHAAGEDVTYPPNPTYPNIPVGWRLDYCFVTPTLTDCIKRTWIDNDARGSDHQPMWVELELP